VEIVMSIYSRILYAVKDTDPRRASALRKVIALARACDARLDLFHAVSTPLFLPEQAGDISIADLKRDTVDLHRSRLEKLAVIASRRGVHTSCTVAWDHPPHEAIVRHASETGADLVVAHGHETGIGRWSLRPSDWELLRASRVPVLLLRDTRP
jgi:nucleotide-binding universal stress UspA family protein